MKFGIKHIVIGITVAMYFSSTSHTQTILRFKSEINDKASRLGDILMIKNDKHHWSTLSLDSHPTPGDTLTKATLLSWMTSRLGHFNATWLGKTRIIVNQEPQSSETLLIEKARSVLIKKLATHYLRVNVTPLSHPKAGVYALNAIEASVNIKYPTAKRVCVWLTHDDGRRIAIWFRVKAYANVLVANRDLHYDTLIQADAFSMKERDIAGLNAPPVKALPQPVWLKTSITRNMILLTNQLKSPPLVVHGQHLNVTAHNHGITVAMDAIALADGYSGETITVKNPINQKTFTARVSGFQQAEMTL